MPVLKVVLTQANKLGVRMNWLDSRYFYGGPGRSVSVRPRAVARLHVSCTPHRSGTAMGETPAARLSLLFPHLP
ncbi:hypothetical protein AGIG_G21452 [Arapaima gigas]